MSSGIDSRIPGMLPVILILGALFFLATPAPASPDSVVRVYSADFTTDPNWSTNNPATNYWDKDLKMWHYLMRDGSGTYVNTVVPYNGESYILAWDILPNRTDYQASVKFGLGDHDQVSVERLTMFTEFENSPYGRIIWIRTIDSQNQRREASSYYLSYGGPTAQFADGIWYHAVMVYRADSRTLTLTVTRRNDSAAVWHYTVDSLSIFPTMDRIYMSKIGDSTNPNAVAEGFIDNVAFSLVFPEEQYQYPGSVPATSPPANPQVTTMPAGSATTTAVPLSPLPVFGAMTAIAAFSALRRKGNH